MRIVFTYIFVLSYSSIAYAQTVEEFLRAYNKHIDPSNKLDSIDHITIKRQLRITLADDNKVIESKATCYHCTNGKERCINDNSSFSDQGSFAATPINASKTDIVRYMLNWIFFDSNSGSFRYKLITDSIVVVEELVNSLNRNLLTFDKLSLNLLQIRSISGIGQLEVVRDTNFLEYKSVSGILVPGKMSYENSICKASVDYLYVSFETFNQSIFD